MDEEEITMLQPLTSTALHACDDSDLLPEDQQGEITTPDGILDEAGWQALLIRIDREESGP